jgi:hypothetical protein
MYNQFMNWATGLPSAVADGIRAGAFIVPKAILAMFQKVIPFMPGSDADRGPLSSLTSWGSAIPRTIAGGITGAGSMIKNAITGALGSAGSAAWNMATDIGGRIADGVKSGIRGGAGAITGAVGSAVGAAKKAGSAVKSTAGAAKGMVTKTPGRIAGVVGGMAKDAAGLASKTPGGMAVGAAAGAGQEVLNDTTMEVHFDGEVHDAEKVEDMVRKGMDKASKEAESRISDGLDMASDSIGGLFD